MKISKKGGNFSKITSRWWGFLYSHSCFCGGWATSFLNWDDFFLNNKLNIRIKFSLELDKSQKILIFWGPERYSKIVHINFSFSIMIEVKKKKCEFLNLTIFVNNFFYVIFLNTEIFWNLAKFFNMQAFWFVELENSK